VQPDAANEKVEERIMAVYLLHFEWKACQSERRNHLIWRERNITTKFPLV